MGEILMYLWKVTIFAKKPWMDLPLELSWACVADTSDGAIEQVTDAFDLDGVTIERVKAEKVDGPMVLLNIKEKF